MKKNQKTNQRHQAFSLIEISIVILIIGILLVGVTQSSRLVNQIKISSAQSITRSSEVSSISDIVFWAETTLDGALTNVNGSFQFEDGNSISSWNDINVRSNPKINVLQSNTSFQPTFKQNGINGLPSVSFNGANQIFISTTIAPLPANNKNYSLVLVWRANSVSVAAGQMLMSQTGNAVLTNEIGSIFITASSTYGFAGNNNDACPTSVSPNINYISVITVNNTLATNNISLYTNSNTATNSTSTNPSTLQLAASRFSIGGRADSLQFFGGLISEAIVFDRTLKPDEVRAINNYLGKKYSIKIS